MTSLQEESPVYNPLWTALQLRDSDTVVCIGPFGRKDFRKVRDFWVPQR